MRIKWNMITQTRDLEAVACVKVDINFGDFAKFTQRYLASVNTWNGTNNTTVFIGDISEGELVREMVLELGYFPTLTEGMIAAHKVIEKHNDCNIENALKWANGFAEIRKERELF